MIKAESVLTENSQSVKRSNCFIDRTGQVFGRLRVIEFAGTTGGKTGRKRSVWRCQCDCGNITLVKSDSMKCGNTFSCGCLNTELTKARSTEHGMTYSPTWKCWNAMIGRCYVTSHTSYPRYGARGIIVCDRWRHSFSNFLDDMGERPTLRHTVDRRENSLGYSPENCGWATYKEQNRNKSNNHRLTIGDRTMTIVEWSEESGVRNTRICSRIRAGWSPERAVFTPT